MTLNEWDDWCDRHKRLLAAGVISMFISLIWFASTIKLPEHATVKPSGVFIDSSYKKVVVLLWQPLTLEKPWVVLGDDELIGSVDVIDVRRVMRSAKPSLLVTAGENRGDLAESYDDTPRGTVWFLPDDCERREYYLVFIAPKNGEDVVDLAERMKAMTATFCSNKYYRKEYEGK